MRLKDFRTLLVVQLCIIGFMTMIIHEFGLPEISNHEILQQDHFWSSHRSFQLAGKLKHSKHGTQPENQTYVMSFNKVLVKNEEADFEAVLSDNIRAEKSAYTINFENKSAEHNLQIKKIETLVQSETLSRLEPTNQTIWTAIGFLGQLGNQMFQLASAYGIAKSRGSRLCLFRYVHSDLYSSVDLNADISDCPDLYFPQKFEDGFGAFDATFMSERGNLRVHDFLQSYKYFDNVPFVLKTKAWAESWVEEHGVTVGIHVRRGDYVSRKDNGGRPPPPLYYEYCLHLVRQRHGPFKAVVVSDDPDWVRAQPVFAGATVHVGSPAEDMAILAACRHVVASIGTFGWWAMRLKGRPGECFYYSDPWDYDVVPDRRKTFKAADHFLPSWTGVGDAELAAFRASAAYAALHPEGNATAA